MAISYAIAGGADAGKFNINTSTGQVTFKAAPSVAAPADANANNIYEVTVRATDDGGNSVTRPVLVTVTPVVADPPPRITSGGAYTVAENTTAAFTVVAIDPGTFSVVDPGPLPPGDPVTIFTQAPPVTGSDSNPNVNFRTMCVLAQDMQDEFRVTLQPGANMSCMGLAVGKHNGDFFANSTVPLVLVKFAGASGFTNQSTPQTSDWMPSGALAGMVAGDRFIVSFMTGTFGQGLCAYTAGSTNSTCQWQSDDGTLWDDQTVVGYNNIGTTVYGAARVETRTAGAAPPSDTDIPMSFNDPMFTGMTTLTDPLTLSPGQNLTRTSIDEHSGNSTISCTSNNTVSYCRVFSRECVRITGSAALDHCYLEALGVVTDPPDHADTIQHYSPGQRGAIVTVSNCHIVAHPVEATAGHFIADYWDGTVTFENVIFNGGPFGAKMFADTGCTLNLSFKDCYFVGPFVNEYGNVPYVIESAGGTLNILKWENVRNATIVDNVLVPGTAIASP